MNPEILISFFAIFVSIVSAFFSVWYSRQQLRHEQKHGQQVIIAETLMHFTKTYHEVLETDNRPLSEKVEHPVWISSYWGLQGSEFYFFHHGTIPAKMYAIWMTDVVDMYARFPRAWEIHKKYLRTYGKIYEEMERFFDRIHEFSKITDKELRYTRVKNYVYDWIETNQEEF